MYASDESFNCLPTDCHSIQMVAKNSIAFAWASNNQCCQLKDPQQNTRITETNWQTKSQNYNIYPIEITACPKTSLWAQGRQDVSYIRAILHDSALQMLLLLRETLVFSVAGLHGWATNPVRFNQSILQLAKQLIRWTVISAIKISG